MKTFLSSSSSTLVLLFGLLIVMALAEEQQENGYGRPPAPTNRAPTTRPTTKAPTTQAPTTQSPTAARENGHGHMNGPRPQHHRPSSPPSTLFYTPYEEANMNVTRALYEQLIYPRAKQILTSGVYPAGIFSNITAGRIVPVGDFDDQIGSFEYFYGLGGARIVLAVNFIHLIAKGNLVAVRVDIYFSGNESSDPARGNFNLTQEGWLTFDEESRISAYDLVILRLGEAEGVTPPSSYLAYYEAICNVHQEYCVPANQQYATYNDCLAQLATMNFGTWDNAASNTTTCRTLHSILVPLRPDYHCPHIGPTGGSACIDVPYSAFYDDEY